MKNSKGQGFVVLLIIIALLAFIFFGVRFRSADTDVVENRTVIEQGLDATKKASDLRDTLNSQNRALEDF